MLEERKGEDFEIGRRSLRAEERMTETRNKWKMKIAIGKEGRRDAASQLKRQHSDHDEQKCSYLYYTLNNHMPGNLRSERAQIYNPRAAIIDVSS